MVIASLALPLAMEYQLQQYPIGTTQLPLSNISNLFKHYQNWTDLKELF